MTPLIQNLLGSKQDTFKRLDIRLDTPTVYIKDNGEPAHCHDVTGRVVLMNHGPLPIKAVKISLVCERKVSWYTDLYTAQHIQKKETLLARHKCLYPPSNTTPTDPIPAGNHVWPFTFKLDTPLVESIEGLPHVYVLYRLVASVIFAGYLTKDLHAVQNLRVINSKELDNWEFPPAEQIILGNWREKLDYFVEASPRIHYWGRPIDLNLRFVPLAKDITLGRLHLELRETMSLISVEGKRQLSKKSQKVISTFESDILLHGDDRFDLSDDLQPVEDRNQRRIEFPLPQSLKICRQSVTDERISIVHDLQLEVDVYEREELATTISLCFPFQLTIPPGVIFDEKNDALAYDPSIQHHTHLNKPDVPPRFGDHHNDRLYLPGTGSYPLGAGYTSSISSQAHTTTGQPANLRGTNILESDGSSVHTFTSDASEATTELDLNELQATPSYSAAVRAPEIYANESLPSYTEIRGNTGGRAIQMPPRVVCRQLQP